MPDNRLVGHGCSVTLTYELDAEDCDALREHYRVTDLTIANVEQWAYDTIDAAREILGDSHGTLR